METTELFAVRTFPIWNITVRADTVFEISDFLAKDLIQRGACITMEERKKRLSEKTKKKLAQEAAKLKAEKEPILTESPQPKKTRKPKENEVTT